MTFSNIGTDLLSGFYYSDLEKVSGKIAGFADAGADSLHIVSDFDLTLTAGKVPGQNIGTWDVMDELMTPESVARHKEIYQSFRPIELEGKLTAEIASEKWGETLDLIMEHDISVDDIQDAFLRVAELRVGAKDIFTACEDSGIPTVILSSGIRNVIRVISEHYQIRPTHVLSNDLMYDEATRLVTGWRRDSLIHMLNKKEMGHRELTELRSRRPNVVLIGDVPDDVRMVDGDDVIRIRVLDPRRGEAHDLETVKQASFDAGYDLVVEHSLQPVVDMIEWIISSSPTTAID